jgi:predicted protein tyrosine phosphatase
MIRTINVMSLAKITEFSKQKNIGKYIVVSIASRRCENAKLELTEENNIKDILYTKFNDTDSQITAYGGIKPEEAEQIAVFVKKYMNLNEEYNLIVQCGAGQSRSAGVAAAIMKYLWEDDTPIFNNKLYKPNMRCYRYVLNAFMGIDLLN